MSDVLLEHSGPIAIVTLNRPGRHNSLTPAFLRELAGVLAAVATDDAVRAVVVQANGRSFSTGGDALGFVENSDRATDYANEIVGLLNKTILALIDLPVPVVAAVHGPVTGGSLGFVLAADIVLVSRDASFTPYYSPIGPSPDGGWATLLPGVIGRQRAAAVLMLNETITAEQAVDWGMAHETVTADTIRDAALRTAQRISQMKPGSIAHTRRLLFLDRDEIAARLEAERAHFVEHMATGEPLIGFEAFVANLRAIKGLRTGQTARLTRTFTADDVAIYRDLTADTSSPMKPARWQSTARTSYAAFRLGMEYATGSEGDRQWRLHQLHAGRMRNPGLRAR
jgi:2-(1,2-epoxy-1,2-dihydrophenyl)acetyl-CoA isomerase